MALTSSAIALYLADAIASKYIGDYFDKAISKVVSKPEYRSRLRIVIQNTVEEFNKTRHTTSASKQLHFKDSEAMFIQLLEFQIYKDGDDPLKENSFENINNISKPDKEELNEFNKLFIKNIKADETLRKLYVEENYREEIFKIHKSIDSLNESLEDLKRNTSIQPQITNDSIKFDDPNFRFYYTQRQTNFIGRDNEIKILKEFFFDNNSFSWWIITGKGGVGKSRLALELSIELRKDNVESGFISFHEIRNTQWNNWHPDKPILYIVDYVSNDHAIVHQWIRYLANRTNFRVPVRVLLIDRAVYSVEDYVTDHKDNIGWWDAFANDPYVWQFVYEKQPYSISGLSVEVLVDLVEQIVQREKCELIIDREEIGKSLVNLDALRRPLFAMLAGLALANSENIRAWNQNDLLNFYLSKEENNVRLAFVDHDENTIYQHKNLLILSTICYGLTLKQLEKVFSLNIKWLPTNENYNNELYRALSGFSNLEGTQYAFKNEYFNSNAEEIYLSPFLPDILGEFFVLNNLSQNKKFPLKDRDRLTELKKIVYDVDLPNVNFFTRRILQDFPLHPLMPAFVKEPYKSFFGNRGATANYIVMLMQTFFKGKNDVNIKFWQYTKSLYEEEKIYPSEKSYVDSPDHSYQCATLVLLLENHGNLDEQVRYYEIMRSLSDEFAINPPFTTLPLDEELLNDPEAIGKMLSEGFDKVSGQEWLDNNTVVVARLPRLEAIALQDIIPQLYKNGSIDRANLYLMRLYELIDLYSDPRIKNILLNTLLDCGEEYIDSFYIKIKLLFNKIISNPKQIEFISVEFEQFKFLNSLGKYLLEHNDKELIDYFNVFLDSLQKRKINRSNINTFIDTASLAMHLFKYYYEKGNKEIGNMYFKSIFKLEESFILGIPYELLSIGWEASKIYQGYL